MRREVNILGVLLLFFAGSLNYASGPASGETVQGIWMNPGEREDSSFQWRAHWIWMDPSVENHTMLARYSFELEEEPASALLRITASDRYQLYVNGQYVCRGPARSAPHHQSYDILDISRVLVQGQNSYAVRVHHQQGKRSYQYPGRAGLLVQAEISYGDSSVTLISGKEWMVSPDLSWSNEAPPISRFQDVVNDRVDMRKHVNGWTHSSFVDSTWDRATLLMRNAGWPAPQSNASPQPLTPPWTTLVPRDLPYLIESDVKATSLVGIYQVEDRISETGNIEISTVPLGGDTNRKLMREYGQSADSGEPFLITAGKEEESKILIFDFGEVINGMPKLDIQGEPGIQVDVMCSPYILGNVFTHKIVDTRCLDRITLSGKRDVWEATYFKPARYMAVAIRNPTEKVRLYSAGMRRIEYPFVSAGYLKTPGSPWVEQYWEASKKTITVCTTDGYTDNYRERRQYAQTGYYAALGNYWTFGDYALQRRYLVQVAQEQQANGIMPAYAPLANGDYMVIFDSNCLWIRSLRNYLLFSGDSATVKQLLPAAEKLMELFHSCTDPNGMIHNPPYPYWLDHAQIDRRGANMILNGHYLGALEDFAQVLEWLDEGVSEIYRSRAELLRKSLQVHLWDEDKKLFADALVNGTRSQRFSEHGNAMALALNLASPELANAIARQLLKREEHNFIRRESGLTMVTPAMSYFLHKGLCEAGYVEESFNLLRERFDKMLEPGTNQTLWEEWFIDGTGRTGKFQKKTRSDAQTESAFPPALFVEYMFGITPLVPGMKEVSIARIASGIGRMEGAFSTPQGELIVKWEVNKDSGKLYLSIPDDMKVSLDLESLKKHADHAVTVNGKEITSGLRSEPLYALYRGDHEIIF